MLFKGQYLQLLLETLQLESITLFMAIQIIFPMSDTVHFKYIIIFRLAAILLLYIKKN